MNKKKLFLIILLFATMFRSYRLASVPPSASLDEVSIGYNAYSILQTGKDEYGYTSPLLLRAYDDWRPGLYVYLVVPFVWLLGFSVTSVRLPSVLLSILAVPLVYLLVKELFNTKKITVGKRELLTDDIAFVAFALFAVSPWHIYISRLGHEVNLGFFTVLLGIYLFLKGIHSDKWYFLFFSFISFTVSLYAYQSQKIITPILLLILCALFVKDLWKRKAVVLISGIISIGILIPLFVVSSKPDALIRFKATNAFSRDSTVFQEEQKKYVAAKLKGDRLRSLEHSEKIVFPKIFLQNYLSHFNPQWLFLNAHEDRHKIPHIGLLYVWEILPILIGIVILIRVSLSWRVKAFLLIWLLTSPFPAAITTDAPHAMRTFTFLPTWQILSGIGCVFLLSMIKDQKKLQAKGAFLVLMVTSVTFMSFQYFTVFPKTQSASFQYALAQAMQYTKTLKKETPIVVSNKDNLYQSYMFYLFYTRFDPEVYHKLGGTKSGGYAESHTINNVSFRPITWEKEQSGVFIGNPSDFPKDVTKKSFMNLDRKEAVIVVENE